MKAPQRPQVRRISPAMAVALEVFQECFQKKKAKRSVKQKRAANA